ncbi:UDP-glycosyltransferase 85A2 [Platanthera zijinensis]|uniref:Glycosyltransferase n=1 Tax=Platanthera zijinensis TaxID=2320716 RepID=A0AAP0BK01_9ASPA
MLQFAKLLHSHGFRITFVLTHFNYRRLVRAQGEDAVNGLPDFRFESIADGLPNSDDDATQDISRLCDATTKNCLAPFRRLLADLNGCCSFAPPVTCIVADGGMSFTLDAASELSIPNLLFWTSSAGGYLAFQHYHHLLERGIIPLKDMSDVTNGFLDTEVDWIPGFMKGMRLKDFPSWIRTTDRDEVVLNYLIYEMKRAAMGSAIIFNTFDDLEEPALNALRRFLPPIYAVGPFSILSHHLLPSDSPLNTIGTSLWKEDDSCLKWLDDDNMKPHSVVYVSFGSITVMTDDQLIEFAWGLAGSGYKFIWVIRPDQFQGEANIIPAAFVEETKGRGMMVSWTAQRKLLAHPAIGAFLTHCGWNSTMEGLCGGVPMICWPFFSEQLTNCRYACAEWGVGVELAGEVKRAAVEALIREVMAGEKGREMRRRAAEWKERAFKAAGGPHGGSTVNFNRVVNEVLLPRKQI